jgi:hypothetical protein
MDFVRQSLTYVRAEDMGPAAGSLVFGAVEVTIPRVCQTLQEERHDSNFELALR